MIADVALQIVPEGLDIGFKLIPAVTVFLMLALFLGVEPDVRLEPHAGRHPVDRVTRRQDVEAGATRRRDVIEELVVDEDARPVRCDPDDRRPVDVARGADQDRGSGSWVDERTFLGIPRRGRPAASSSTNRPEPASGGSCPERPEGVGHPGR